jgi:hypothetical protein
MLRSARFAFGVLALTFPLACGGAKPATSAPPAVPAAQSSPAPASANAFTGTIAETMNSGGYTYARLQAAGKADVWIAGNEFPAKTGDTLTVQLEMPMENFESKTLKRTFPVIYFVSSVTRGGQPAAGAASAPQGGLPMAAAHGAPSAPAASAPMTVEPVAPAPGGLSIADVWAKRVSLAGKEVTLRGKVVKVNEAILDRNWVHLQDGSGKAADGTNDITITTDAAVKVGDVVTVKGVLATGKDFGAGYAYKVIVENAKFSAK